MGTKASQITSLTIVYSTVYSDADQRKHQSSASLAFVWGIHRWPVNSPHKWPVTRKMFPFDDVIMIRNRNAMKIMVCLVLQFMTRWLLQMFELLRMYIYCDMFKVSNIILLRCHSKTKYPMIRADVAAIFVAISLVVSHQCQVTATH